MMPEENTIPKSLEQKPKKTARKKLYDLHTWVGFHLAVIMFVVLATGKIATLSNEIDWLIYDEMRVVPTGDEPVSWQEMTDAVEAYLPEGMIVSIRAMDADYFAYRATVFDSYGKRFFVHVNQWTGEVTGTTSFQTVQRFFRDLHRYLFFPSVIGLPIVSAMAFILAISLYTGLKTARNWKTLLFRVRLKKGARVAIGDAHKSIGLWSIWFLLLVIVSGIWYLAELSAAIGGTRFEPSRPNLTTEQVRDFGDVVSTKSTAKIVATANAAFPELEVSEIFFPSRFSTVATVLGYNGNPILRRRANRVFINPVNLEVLKVQRSENISWVSWLNEIADPLHFGTFGGLVTKIIWFVFGLGLTGLSVSGVWLTWKRLRTKAVTKTQIASMPILLLSIIVYFFNLNFFAPPSKAGPENRLEAKQDGNLSVTPIFALKKDGSHAGKLRLLIDTPNGRPNLESVSLRLRSGETVVKEALDLKSKYLDKPAVIFTSFDVKNLAQSETLAVDVSLKSGRTFNLNFNLNEDK